MTRLLGVAVLAVAAAGLAVGVFSDAAPSSVTGAGTGSALLAYGVFMLMVGAREPRIEVNDVSEPDPLSSRPKGHDEFESGRHQ